MIRQVRLTKFKRFSDTTFDLLPEGMSFLAGGNNSGKSTFLQALAVWEFCRVVLEMERGRESLETGYNRQGLGLSDDEFSPVSVASLKHLWTNLKTQVPGTADGYSLAIRCDWHDDANANKHLQISLALANDRLFIKAGATNLGSTDKIPDVTYLPPFAGMQSHEALLSGAERRSMIGRGLAGGVIRNLLFDMHKANEEKRVQLKGERSKIKNSDLAKLRQEDPWEVLQATLGSIFGTQLDVAPFNALYHRYIKVSAVKGTYDGKKFKRYPNFHPRDLMAEGSGFLQWLSVYVLALSPNTKVILLDEPDAHLHTSLQTQLIDRLDEICGQNSKQVLLATHSTEILRHADHEHILAFKGSGAKYLAQHNQKIDLFVGLGSEYAPKLDPLKKSGRMLIVENLSDERLLRAWAAKIGVDWPKNLVAWPWNGGSKERKQLYLQLKAEIPDLRAISLRDRDDLALDQVDLNTLRDKSTNSPDQNLLLRVWRRRHIENYLLCPGAIARAAGWPEEQIVELMAEHALVVPQNFVSRNVADAMLDARGKEILHEHANSVKAVTGASTIEIASAMTADEVPEDVIELLQQINNMCG